MNSQKTEGFWKHIYHQEIVQELKKSEEIVFENDLQKSDYTKHL